MSPKVNMNIYSGKFFAQLSNAIVDHVTIPISYEKYSIPSQLYARAHLEQAV